MLLDRPIDAEAIDVGIEHPVVAPTIDVPIAIQTSIKTVLVYPFTMALWGLIVAGSLAIGFLLMFAGLAVVVPVLGAFDLASLPQGRGTGREGGTSVPRLRRVDLRNWVGQDSNLQPDRYERVELDMVAGIGWCAEESVSDPKLIQSALSRTVREDGTEVRIDIYRLETTDRLPKDTASLDRSTLNIAGHSDFSGSLLHAIPDDGTAIWRQPYRAEESNLRTQELAQQDKPKCHIDGIAAKSENAGRYKVVRVVLVNANTETLPK